MRCLVHGGAGSPPDDLGSAREVLADAGAAGADAGDPVAAVVTAIRALESDPQFNAGRGSAVQSDGVIRTDAGLMTDRRAVGAVAGVRGVEHPIELARRVMADTPHVMLAGDPAVAFAEAAGLATDCDLWTDRTCERWADLDPPGEDRGAQLRWVREQFGDDASRSHDTVGAVATDGERIAAGTSTGGRWCALAGRVGDVPQVGSGFFATGVGGASATGAGEDIARTTLARRAVDHLEAGHGPDRAAELALADFREYSDAPVGLIVLDVDGAAGSTFDSEAMPTAVAGD